MKIEYRVVEQATKACLRVEVEKLLHEGWSFVGGASASSHQGESRPDKYEVGYMQAMVNYIG